MITYTIVLYRQDRTSRPGRRQRACSSVEEAKDSATRWLRLHRNTHRQFPKLYDRWIIAVPDTRKGYRIVATGEAEQ